MGLNYSTPVYNYTVVGFYWWEAYDLTNFLMLPCYMRVCVHMD